MNVEMQNIEQSLILGFQAIEDRQYVPALHIADEVLPAAPTDLDALELRMLALREVGRFEMACDVAREILAADDRNETAIETLGWLSPALAPPALNPEAGLDRPFSSEIPREFGLRIQQAVHHYRYKGLQLVKDPFDLALYPMLLWDQRPRTVIEIGSKAGGSGLWFADQLDTMGIHGHVYSIDVVPVRGLDRNNLTFLEGNGRELERVFSVERLASLPRPWLVIEDADHTVETSLAVLRFFHAHLAPGDYIVVEDGIISDLYPASCPDYSSGPHLALKAFLASEGNSYEIDAHYCDFFGQNATWASNGFLKRIS